MPASATPLNRTTSIALNTKARVSIIAVPKRCAFAHGAIISSRQSVEVLAKWTIFGRRVPICGIPLDMRVRVLFKSFSMAAKENCWYPAAEKKIAWKEGWGWLFRFRFIYGATAVEAVGTMVSIILGWPWYLSLAMGLLLASTMLGTFSLRKVRMYSLDAGASLHRVCHAIRDDVANILMLATSSDSQDRMHYRTSLEHFHNDVANRIAEFFRVFVNDNNVNCCLRLSQTLGSQQVYATRGRSMGLNLQRQALSEAIPSDKGIALILRNKQFMGCYMIHDIPKATADGIWMKTRTDALPDIESMMIVPVNSVIRRRKYMIGILYVSAPGQPFMQLYIEPLMAFADLLGTVYPMIVGRVGPNTQR